MVAQSAHPLLYKRRGSKSSAPKVEYCNVALKVMVERQNLATRRAAKGSKEAGWESKKASKKF